MSAIRLLPYKLSSQGAKELANELGCLRIRPMGSSYRYRSSHRIINWGCSSHYPFPIALNQSEAVAKAVDKRKTWDLLVTRGVATISYHTNRQRALERLESGIRLYGRRTLVGSRGAGISVYHGPEDIGAFQRDQGIQVWSEYFPVRREFRVLVVRDKVVLVSEKKKRDGTNPDQWVRSHNDWVFCRNNLRPYPQAVLEQSISAVAALGLDFGGVDIALNRGQDKTCVLEVNSAPGLVGSSVPLLASALKEVLAVE